MVESFVPPADLLAFIREHDKFIIAGHEEPDADCIGSELAVASLLRRLGKTALLRSSGPFRKAEVVPYEDLFLDKTSGSDRAGAAAIIVDCSEPKRAGKVGRALRGLPLAIIDHHEVARNDERAEAACSYIRPDAPSATVLVFSLFKALSLEIDKDEAALMLLGLCADTGFFRHVDGNGETVFSLAAEFAAAGASPKEAFYQINGGKTLASRLLMGVVLNRTESYFDGKLLVSSEELAETEKYGVKNRDSDALYQLLMSIGGVEAVAVMRQSASEQCAIGLRSRNSIDVAKIAAVFGGGGHKNAAGASVDGRIAELKRRIVEEFGKAMNGLPPN
ncbi:MAG: bifunctional oligoribonuclease/PAP phosphatase NrnA [Spirochaetaceae bacterium]|jgi:phosphoesterase RecJ-like protein|nr:bifunctional oligoribonuclease/PAP phosphatase NrnA [Spirochaetaceae bacterium]